MRRMLLASVAGLVLLSGLAEAQQQFPTVVLDIWPGPNPSTPHALATMGNTLFFAAEDNRSSAACSYGRPTGPSRAPCRSTRFRSARSSVRPGLERRPVFRCLRPRAPK
jgi:hypothetical protein